MNGNLINGDKKLKKDKAKKVEIVETKIENHGEKAKKENHGEIVKTIHKKGKEQNQQIVVTMRCIDMASPTSDVDKKPCSKCGEMTWISKTFRKMKIDDVICNPCFIKSDMRNEEDIMMCVTEETLNDALSTLERRGIRTTKEEMIRRLEEEVGRKLIVRS